VPNVEDPWVGGLDEVAVYGTNVPVSTLQAHYLAYTTLIPVLTPAVAPAGYVEVEGVGAGAFNPQLWQAGPPNLVPDYRFPWLSPWSGAYRNIYAPSAVQTPTGYVVVARLTTNLHRQCAGIKEWTVMDEHHDAGEFTVKLFGWSKERRFVVVRERIRETKAAVGRRLLDVPGYTFRVWVTNRKRPA
jgi:hypothetical protein